MLIPLGILDFPTGAAGAYELIESNILTSSASSVTFSSIPTDGTYSHLQLRVAARTTDASFTSNLLLRYNSITSGYFNHALYGSGSVGSFAQTGQSAAIMGEIMALYGDSGHFGASVIDILDYASTTKNKTTRALTGVAGGSNSIYLRSAAVANTSAISSITLLSSAGSFVANSRFSLYGVKGA